MSSPRSLLSLGVLCTLAMAGAAQDTSEAVILVGGPGSCSSEGTCDPGLLNDGATEASARLLFTLDRVSSRLTLELRNTSPVVAGVPNPLLTRAYFNAPATVTNMTLVSQSAAEGLQPSFSFGFDTLHSFSAGAFGSFQANLREGLQGGIANPEADAYATSSIVSGPVVFVFDVEGDLTTVTASSFTNSLSEIPTGATSSQAAVKFQGGGDMAGFSAYLNQGVYCDTLAATENLGGGCGATLTCSAPVMGEMCTLAIDGNSPGGRALLMASLPRQAPFAFQGCDVFLNLGRRMMVRVVDVDDQGDISFEVASPAYADSPECCGVSLVIQAIILSDQGPLPLGEITNAVKITLGS
jgi:hypothetical protein